MFSKEITERYFVPACSRLVIIVEWPRSYGSGEQDPLLSLEDWGDFHHDIALATQLECTTHFDCGGSETNKRAFVFDFRGCNAHWRHFTAIFMKEVGMARLIFIPILEDPIK
jgi:hypothetical protein